MNNKGGFRSAMLYWSQLIKRQQSNEQALVKITSELYELQAQLENTDMRLQETGKKLNYQRPIE